MNTVSTDLAAAIKQAMICMAMVLLKSSMVPAQVHNQPDQLSLYGYRTIPTNALFNDSYGRGYGIGIEYLHHLRNEIDEKPYLSVYAVAQYSYFSARANAGWSYRTDSFETESIGGGFRLTRPLCPFRVHADIGALLTTSNTYHHYVEYVDGKRVAEKCLGFYKVFFGGFVSAGAGSSLLDIYVRYYFCGKNVRYLAPGISMTIPLH